MNLYMAKSDEKYYPTLSRYIQYLSSDTFTNFQNFFNIFFDFSFKSPGRKELLQHIIWQD